MLTFGTRIAYMMVRHNKKGRKDQFAAKRWFMQLDGSISPKPFAMQKIVEMFFKHKSKYGLENADVSEDELAVRNSGGVY